jgi:hypothetical protein
VNVENAFDGSESGKEASEALQAWLTPPSSEEVKVEALESSTGS